MFRLICRLATEAVPVAVMIGLIPFVVNDVTLSALYLIVIAASLAIHYEKQDLIFFTFGFVVLSISEYVFVSTGVEVFLRNSLFGVMPLWLPILWGYAFVAIQHSVLLLKDHLR